ncbi:MAG: dienelactone hydrolase family protein [Litoreibacter sp.]
MPALDAPVRSGRLSETIRDDLFAPMAGRNAREYTVPTEIADVATSHDLHGRRWYSYHTKNTFRTHPVVFLFHGSGRNGLSMIDMWRRVADREGLFLIALDGDQLRWPMQDVAPTILHDILSEAETITRLDLDQVYLFGHSNGARYAQILNNLTEGPWRATAVHAGFNGLAAAIIPENPKPIRFYLGNRDHIFSLDTLRDIANGLAERGHQVDIQIIPDHNHWFYVAGPAIAADAWAWLKRQ